MGGEIVSGFYMTLRTPDVKNSERTRLAVHISSLA